MLRVALTGGLGSGKSTAAAVFQSLGCFVSQSDEIARAMMQPGQAVFQAIVQRFGRGVLRPDGALDRTALATLAFREHRAEDLNSIVHPAVIAAQTEWLNRIGAQHPHAVAMVESALIFETKHGHAAGSTGNNTRSPVAAKLENPPWRTRFDRIVLVTAPQEVRIERYIARSGASSNEGRAAAESDARARMGAQMPEEEKANLSDWVIQNDGSVEQLEQRVTEVWHLLQVEATGHAG